MESQAQRVGDRMKQNDWELNETDLFNLYGSDAAGIARAANKKLIEWLKEPCSNPKHGLLSSRIQRRDCFGCWLNLKMVLK